MPRASLTRYDCCNVVNSARQLSGPSTTYEIAKVVALVRDGFQCIFTGRYDRVVGWALPDVKKHVEKHDLRISSTKASFILPERYHDPNSDDEDDYQPTSVANASLHTAFDPKHLRHQNRRGVKVQSRQHIDHGNRFNTFGLWLNQTETPHQCKVRYTQELCVRDVR